jgi:hypothetical protein
MRKNRPLQEAMTLEWCKNMAEDADPRGRNAQSEARPALTSLAQTLQSALAPSADGGLPSVHRWNPPFCGDIDMRIARDGSWFYNGSKIERPALVKLFASILRKDPERYVLVTPVERVGIRVDDAPFLAVELAVIRDESGQSLEFRTNLDERVRLDADHPLRFEPADADGLKPYLRVRDDLWALVTRPVYLELVEIGETRECDGAQMFGIASGATFFPMAPAADL